jgi:lipid-A-disaccharide synthase
MACLRADHVGQVQAQLDRQPAYRFLPLEIHASRTPEIIHVAHSCLSVSGSVGLELLHATKPAVVLYRTHFLSQVLYWMFATCRYVGLVNLLADRLLYPEYVTPRCPARAMSEHILRWLQRPEEYEQLRRELETLKERVGQPGACARAAERIRDVILSRSPRRSAA